MPGKRKNGSSNDTTAKKQKTEESAAKEGETTNGEPQLSPMLKVRPGEIAPQVRYYVDVLGFQSQMVVPNMEKPVYADVKLGNSIIMFGEFPVGELSEEHSKFVGADVSFYIPVPDIDTYFNEIREKGAKIVAEPENKPWGVRAASVKDYSGFQVDFYSKLENEACLVCSYPMLKAEDHGGKDPKSPFCVYCCDADGKLKSKEEIEVGITQFAKSMLQLGDKEALKYAQDKIKASAVF